MEVGETRTKDEKDLKICSKYKVRRRRISQSVSVGNLEHFVLMTYCHRLWMLSYLVYIGVSLFGLFL